MKLLEHFHKLSIYPSNAKELKGLVLQLAVQGKLTADWRLANPDVEPAAVLLERIKEEKQELIKAKKIKKEKTLPAVQKDEIPFELPEEWIWCKLGEVGSYNYSLKKQPSDVKNNTWVLELEDIEKSTSKLLAKVRYSDRNFKSSKSVFQKGDILYGKLRPYLDKVIIADEEGVCTTEIIPIKVYSGTSSQYLRFFLKSPKFIEYANNSTHGMNLPRMGTDKGLNALIAYPPLAEQKAIVKIVDTLLQEVTQLEELTQQRLQLKEKYATAALNQVCEENTAQAWADLKGQFSTFFNEEGNIKKLRETILQLAVQGKLTTNWRLANPDVESAAVLLERIKVNKLELIKTKKIKKEKPLPAIEADEVPYTLPEGWVWCRLRDLTEVITKGSSPKWQGVSYVREGDGILFITSENVGNYKILLHKKKYVESKFNDIEPRSILQKNDILMNIVGGSIGRTAIFNLDETANINQAVTIIRLFKQFKLDYNYFLHFFNSPICINYMYDKQVDNARPNLSMGNIAKFKIPLPSLQEQKAIVKKVNQLMDFCDTLEEEVIKGKKIAKELMQVVLKEVFEGKVVETI